VDPFLYIIAREEQFDKTVSLNMNVMKLERSGKTALYHKDKDNGLEHQDWDRGPRNLVVPWATFRDSVIVFVLL
jgi:hypothetical protein